MPKKPFSDDPFIGKRFGRLTLLDAPQKNVVKRKHPWVCICDCGKRLVASRYDIIRGHTRSCGCLQLDYEPPNKTHGMSNTSLYRCWAGIVKRCEYKKDKRWAQYGGRGIRVCPEWRKSFATFARDMGTRPSGTTIERIDNDKGYSPDNCRWATAIEQIRNRSCSKSLTFKGETKSLQEWADETGISYKTMWARVFMAKWPTEKVLTKKLRRKSI